MHLRIRPAVWPLVVAAAALSCSSDNLTLPNEGLPAALAVVSGGAQTAVVATPLPDSLLVRVTDSESRPVEGIKIAFTPLLGGGDAVPDTGVTNADGRTGIRWILGSTAGAQRMQAMVTGETSSGALTQNFDATALAAAADTVFSVRGNSQSAEVGGSLPDSLVVRITDRFGNSVSGSVVTWGPTGGGSVSPSSSTTGITGTAATRRTLGTTAGPQGATATASALKGSPVAFTMTALPAAPTSLVKVSGDNQSGAVSAPLTDSLVVRLLDASGNGVPGRNVTFAIATGNGTVSPTSSTTDAGGRAAARWTLGPIAGGNSLIASSSGFSVTFQATGNSAAATTLLSNSPVTQNGTAGLPAGSAPSVRVTDANGNPVAGVAITFAVSGGGGSILPVTPISTNASGIATLTQWVLGTVAGSNTVTASAAGLTPSLLTFSATGAAGSAAQLQVQTQPSSSAQSGVALAIQPTVRLADVFGNPVTTSGTPVTAGLALGTGTLGGTLTANTVSGVATFTNLSITGPSGTYAIRFTTGSLTPDTTAAITIGAGVASRLAMVTQPSTTAPNAVAFAQQPRVQVQDAAGNPVAGVRSVTVAINSGGGSLGGTAILNTDAAGLATFAGLSITGSTGNRTLVFSSTGLTSIVSGTVTITAGAPTQMAVNAGNGQSATAGSPVAVDPSVIVRDVSNNPVPGVAVTFAVASGGGSVLPITAVTTTAAGIATVTSWTLGIAAGPNTLTADAAPAGITGDPVTFTATAVAGGAGRLGIVTQPPAAAINGTAFSQTPVIQLQDVNGNPVTTAGITITAAIGSGPGGVLGGDPTQPTDVNGRATFPGLSVTGLVGAYTLQFTGVSLTGVTSTPITLSAGTATQLAITTEPPASAQSGLVIAPATVVQVRDVSGNLVTTSTATVTAALASGGGALTGTLSTAAVGGVATFSNLILTGTIGARTLTFASTGLTSDVSTAISLTPGTATALEYVQQPTTVTAGVAIAPAPTVRVRDGAGNTVTAATTAVTVALGANPGASTLSGTTTVNAAAGVATFSTLSLNRSAAGYTLSATAVGLTTATSAAFTVNPAAATTIAANSATTQTDTAGLAVAAPPSARVTDANGNPVAGVSVTFAVTGGGGSILPVTPIVTGATGLATLTSWTLGTVAGTNTVTATAAGLTGSPVTFTATGVAGAATQLVIQTQPSGAAQSGVAFAVQPAVRLADVFGNTVPTTGTVVTAALATGAGTLGGTLTANTTTGVATFANLSITGPTGAYTVRFTSGALAPDTSTAITIGAGAATKLAMVTQPSTSATNGLAFPVQPSVQLQDAANNPVAQAGVVITAALSTGNPALGGTLTATTNAGGLATFTNLSITGTVGARTLLFTSPSLTQVVSGSVTTTAGAATQIAINAGNGQTATVNTAVTTPLSVLVRDVSLNPVAGVSVTFGVASGGGSILPVAPVVTNASGIAALTSWTLGNLAGANSVTATAAGLTGSPLTFTATGTAGAATQLVIQTQPSAAAQSGVALAVQPAVRLGDAFGNLVNTGGTVVTAALASGTGTLGGTLTASTVAGVATFTNLSITGVSGAYTLRFTSGALTPDTTTAITIGAGASARLLVQQQPSATTQNAVAFAQQPTVQLVDGAGNPVAVAGTPVTVAILTGGGTLGGTATVNTAAGGLATFAGLSITGAVGARTLLFSSAGLTPDTSAAVTVTAGAATQIAINAGNGQSATVNTAVATPPSAIVRDVSSNPVAGVSVSFAVAGGGGSILPVTPIVTNASGIAALTSWTMGTLAGPNSITATSGTLIGSPVTFTATGTAGAATQLQVATQPSPAAQSGAALAVQPAIRLADALGNPVATSGTVVTAAIGSGTGTLGGTLTATTVSGVATFANLAISGTAGAFTLNFTAGGVTGVSSATITLGAGAANRLAMVVQPSASAQNAIAFPQQPQVQVQDAAGNPVTGVVPISVAILTGGGTLGGTTPVSTNAAGLATFAGLSITGTAGPRTLQFTSAGLTPVTSAAVALAAGAPTQMAVSAGNAQSGTAGSAVAVDPAVIVRDVSNNPVSGVAVTFAVASGGGSVLPATPVSTDASGIAAATSWTLGGTAGPNSLTATAAPGGITGNPVTFTATGVAGSAGRLAMFTQPPGTAQSGVGISPPPVVQLQDNLGNPVATSGVGITASIASGPGGTLSGGTIALTDVNGRAVFNSSNLVITGPTGAYTLQFSGTSLTGVTSSAITLSAGGAARVTVTAQPATAQSGIAFPSAPAVQVEDAAGNPVLGAGRNVVVSLLAGGGSFTGTLTQPTNAAGVATFPGLVITGTIGPRTLLFSSAGIASDTTAAITLTPGAATALEYVQQPTTVVAGQVIAPSPTVRIRDGAGNTVTTATNAVTVALVANPGTSTLGGTTTVSAVAGVATFSTLTLNRSAAGYTLGASAAGLTGATSSAFTVSPGAATALAITTSPPTGQSGVVLSPQPVVRLVDANGNTVPTNGVSVTATLASGGGTLGGTLAANTVSGVATFSNLSLSGITGAYTINFSSGALTSVTTGAIALSAGAPAALSFFVQPSDAASGAAIAPAVVVRVLDGAGNLVPTATNSITIGLGSNPGGSTLSGTITANAVAGAATFSTLSLNLTGAGYTLTAGAAGLTGATSTGFAVTPGAATRLVYLVAPSTVTAGATMSPAVQVEIQDVAGNRVSGATNAVTVALAANPGASTLGGTTTVSAVAGVATFGTLTLNRTSAGYTMAASAAGLTGVTSAGFTVNPGAAAALAVTSQPTAGQSGAVLAAPLVVRTVDANGNTVPTSGTLVTAALASGAGALSGTLTAGTVSGVATFTNLVLTGTIGAYTLNLSAPTLTSITTGTITLSAGTPAALAFVAQPTNVAAGAALTPAVTVRVLDGAGNFVPTATNSVSMGLGTNPGGSVLGGTTVVSAVAGVATFSTLTLDKTGAGYTLAATSAGLTGAASSGFAITPGAANRLAYVVQPTTATAGATISPAPQVEILDVNGNRVTGSTAAVTLALGANPGGSTLGGTATVNAVAGLATFGTLSLNRTGTGYTLAATSGALTGATSAAFNINPGAATALAITTTPTTGQSGVVLAPQPVIRLVDANGNTVPNNSVTITAALASGSGTLGGVLTAVTTSGVASFSSLALTGTAGAYTLNFSAGGLTPVTSGAIALSAGAPAALAYLVQPSTVTAGALITPAVQVRVLDGAGNTVLTATNPVTLALSANPGGSTLGGTLSTAAVAGVATFSTLTLDRSAAGYALGATAAGLTGATSTAFTVNPGAAAALVVNTAPTTAQSGVTLAPQPAVRIVDALGNTVPTTGTTVTAALASGGGALGGTLTANTVSGVATFTNLVLTGTIGNYTLTFTAPAVTGVTTGPIAVAAGAPTAVEYLVQPSAVVAGASIAPAVQVRLRDGAGNTVTTATNAVTLALGANPGGSTLGGTTSAAAVAGVATFGTLTLNRSAAGYTLTAASTGLIGDTSATFTVNPGAATALAITTAPTTGQSGVLLAPQPVIRLVDANGNTVPTTGTVITAALATGTGTLGGTLTANTVSGVATFATLAITGTAGNFTISFTSGALTAATTGAIAVSAGVPAALAFQQQPGSSIAGASITPSVQVRVLDGAGNLVTTATTPITLTIGTNPGAGVLGGTATQSAVAGVAAFPGLSLNRTGTGYTLVANGGALTPATSTAFDITPAAASALAFIVQPSTVVAGVAIAPAVQIEVRDAFGNRVTTSTASITMVIGTNPGGSTLGGTTTVSAVAGVATFGTLSLDRSGVGYTLTANSGGLTSATSAAFTVDPGAAAALAITTMPTTGTNGVALTPAAVVRLVDVNGNTVPTTGTTITAALSSGSGTLGGTPSALTSSGLATFSNLILTGTAGPYTINFSSGVLTAVTSGTVTLSVGAANSIASNSTVTQGGTAGQPAATPPSVRVTDTGGNPVSGVAVTFAVTAGGGSLGAPLIVATNGAGIATIASWTLGAVVGTNTVTATAAVPSGSPVTFTATSVAGAANSIVSNSATSQSATVGTAVGAPPSVLVRDAGLNPVAGVNVTFAVTAGAGSLGAPTVVATNASGIATAASWTLGTAAGTSNNTVTASAAVPSGSPVTFTASGLAGAANTIAANSLVSQTDTVGLAVAAPPSVLVTDLNGNPVAGISVTFTVTGGGGSIVPVTATPVVTNGSGIATLTSWTLGTGIAVGGNTVTATAAVPSGSPVTFTATGVAGVPTALVFGTPPSGTTVGAAITPSVTVRIVDAFGNLTTSTASVGLVIGNNPGTATLGGTPTRSAVAGVATFNDLALNAAGVGYTLNASSTGLPTIPSAAFTVGVATTTTVINSDLPDPSVTGQPVTVSFGVTSGGGTPTGTVTVTTGGSETCSAPVATGSCSLTFLTVGAKTITASYPGNANFGASASAGAGHTVNTASTTSLLAGHTPNPSTRGAPVAATWAISAVAPGTGTPTGTVTVTDGVDSCNAVLPAIGCSITLTTVGARALTATYAGDANYLTSVSPGVSHTVSPAASTTTITNDTPDPTVVGQPFAVTFTVTGPSGTPTGNVSVSDGVESCIGTAAAGTCNLTLTTVGSRPLTATYVGDANYTGSASLTAPHAVNQAATTTSITSFLPTTADTLTPVAVNWSVLPVGPGAGTPTGTVVVTTDGAETCSAAVGANSCSLTFASSGPRLVTVSYQGDAQFLASATAATPYAVTP